MWEEIFQGPVVPFIQKMVFAVLCGGVIGFEREYHHKHAGLRTTILICLGSTLFTAVALNMDPEHVDRTRIAAQIVTGIGFLGAGTIMRTGVTVTGLTTAATIWVVAAVGVWIGFDHFGEALIATVFMLIILSLLSTLERVLQWNEELQPIAMEIDNSTEVMTRVRKVFKDHRVDLQNTGIQRIANGVLFTGEFLAPPRTRRSVLKKLESLEGVRKVRDTIL